jgi:retron-type reverse transcriptase
LALPIPYIIDDFSLAMHLNVRCRTVWYCVQRKRDLYKTFRIPKANGKVRVIHNPARVLKYIQKKVDQVILKPLPLNDCVAAYVPGKSCRDSAEKHVGQGVRIGMDLKDFFPSHSRARVRWYFTTLGYSRFVAGILSDLCTVGEPRKDGSKTPEGHPRLRHSVPQGSPASPSLCNLIAQKVLDEPLLKGLEGTGWVYTRYSDDLTLSHPDDLSRKVVDGVIEYVRQCIQAGGYRTNPKKTKVQRRWRRQKMLGMVINEKTSIPRETYRKFRSLLWNCIHHGFEPNSVRYGWDEPTSFPSHLQGKVSYFKSIDASKAAKLDALLQLAIQKHEVEHAQEEV